MDKNGCPSLYSANQIQDWPVSAFGAEGTPFPARPLGFQGLCFMRRLELAWGVFIGRYDALRWKSPTMTTPPDTGERG